MEEWMDKYLLKAPIDHKLTMLLAMVRCIGVIAVAVGIVTVLGGLLYDCLAKTQKEIETRLQQQQELQQENNRQRDEINELKDRVSAMASEKLTEGNPTVEDLNDPHRPTALARRWNGLFRCGEYWTAYEAVKKVKGQDGAAPFLFTVCQVTYKTTKKYVEDLTKALSDEISDQHSGLDPVEQQEGKSLSDFLSDNGEAENMLRSLKDILSRGTKVGSVGEGGQVRRAISQLLKSRSPPASLSQAVTRAVGELEISPEHISSFVDQLTELIYYMRVQDIKVVVDFDCKAGMLINPELYEVESGKTVDNPRSAVVKAVMRPALLRHEQGPVLCKGEVELLSPQPNNCRLGSF